MQHFLVLDPGETTGWALFTTDGQVLRFGEVQYGAELYRLLTAETPDFYLYEEFRLRTKDVDRRSNRRRIRFTPNWDLVVAARAIGMIEGMALRRGRNVKAQEAGIKPSAAQAFGLPNKGSHQMDAILHGYYYLWKNLNYLPETIRNRPALRNVDPPTETRVVPIASLGDVRKASKKLSR